MAKLGPVIDPGMAAAIEKIMATHQKLRNRAAQNAREEALDPFGLLPSEDLGCELVQGIPSLLAGSTGLSSQELGYWLRDGSDRITKPVVSR